MGGVFGQDGPELRGRHERGHRVRPDPDQVFADKCNMGMVELGPVEGEDIDELKGYIEKHVAATESTVGSELLSDWDNSVRKFVRVMPTDYKAVLEKMKAEEDLEATA